MSLSLIFYQIQKYIPSLGIIIIISAKDPSLEISFWCLRPLKNITYIVS